MPPYLLNVSYPNFSNNKFIQQNPPNAQVRYTTYIWGRRGRERERTNCLPARATLTSGRWFIEIISQMRAILKIEEYNQRKPLKLISLFLFSLFTQIYSIPIFLLFFFYFEHHVFHLCDVVSILINRRMEE